MIFNIFYHYPHYAHLLMENDTAKYLTVSLKLRFQWQKWNVRDFLIKDQQKAITGVR